MKKLSALTFCLLFAFSWVSPSVAYIRVGVHSGDWIEYNVTTTGNPTPIHNITWARLDVKAVEGSAVSTDIQTRLGNGTLWLEPNTNFNVATGVVGEGVIIPTDLAVGDVYFSEYEGNITVTGTQTLEVAGAQRVILTGEANNTRLIWDKQTGIMVEATTVLGDCTVYSAVAATNLWQPQIIGLDANVFYAVIAAFVAVVLVGVFLKYRSESLGLVFDSYYAVSFIWLCLSQNSTAFQHSGPPLLASFFPDPTYKT